MLEEIPAIYNRELYTVKKKKKTVCQDAMRFW